MMNVYTRFFIHPNSYLQVLQCVKYWFPGVDWIEELQEHKYDFSGCSPNCLTCTFSIQIIVLGRSFTHPQMATYLKRVYQCRMQQII